MPAGLPHPEETTGSIRARIDDVIRRFGKGETFDRWTRNRILDGTVPVWLATGTVVLRGEAQKRCKKALQTLVEMREKFGREIDGWKGGEE